jgi:type VI secretion system secreted protein Hcp
MAGAIFLKIDGIDGESAFDGHKAEIDVLSWSWGVTQQGTTHVGGGGGAGKANVNDLSFVHSVDLASPNLLKNCFTGKHIKEALLTQRKAGGDKSLPYLTIKMTDVIISSVQPGGSDGSAEKPTESVTLNFADVEYIYKQQDDKTGAEKKAITVGFNIKENTSR